MLTVEAIEENLFLQIQEDDISLTMQIADSAPSGVVVSGAPGNVLQTNPDGLYVGAVQYVQTIDDLALINPDSLKDGQSAQVVSTSRAGLFRWQSGDLSAEVAADPLHGIYVPSDGDDGSGGAWVREYDGTLSPLYFGAMWDGVTDDTAAINASLEALPEGGTWVLPFGSGLCEDIDVNKQCTIYCFGELKRKANRESTYVVSLNAPGTVAYNLTANGNGAEESVKPGAGRRVGIRVVGRDTTLYNPKTYDNASENYGGIEMREQCTIVGGVVINAARAYNSLSPGFEMDGSGTITYYSTIHLIDCSMRKDDGLPGRAWVNNGNCGCTIIDNFSCTYENGSTGFGIFLGETGAGHYFDSLVIRNTTVHANSGDGNNLFKTVRVRNVLLENVDFKALDAGSCYRIQEQYDDSNFFNERVTIRNSRLESQNEAVNYDPQPLGYAEGAVSFRVEDSVLVSHGTSAVDIDSVNSATFRNVRFEGAFTGSAVAVRATEGTFDGVVSIVLDTCELAAPNAAALWTSSGQAVLPKAGTVKVVNELLNGAALAPTFQRRLITQTNLAGSGSGCREFALWRPDVDVGAGWEVGDKIYSTDPGTFGFIGYVCVTAGTAGEDAEFRRFGALEDP